MLKYTSLLFRQSINGLKWTISSNMSSNFLQAGIEENGEINPL